MPLTPVSITDEKTARAVLALIDALEDNDDVQNVYSNYDIPDDIMEKAQAAYLRACRAFSEDLARRTCKSCGTVHPAIDLAPYRWAELSAEVVAEPVG